MCDEQKLYVQQMELWFKEQQRIDEQLERAVSHYLKMADLNKQQLLLHRKRTELARNEYNLWFSSLDKKDGDRP